MRSRIQVLLCVAALVFGDAICAQEKETDMVNYCELTASPDVYDGKQVSTFALYSYGWEWQVLFCMECRSIGRITWVEFSDDHVKQLRRQLRRAPKHTGVIAGRFTGVFRRRPVPANGYEFEFELHEASDVRVLIRDPKTPLPSIPTCCELLERDSKRR